MPLAIEHVVIVVIPRAARAVFGGAFESEHDEFLHLLGFAASIVVVAHCIATKKSSFNVLVQFFSSQPEASMRSYHVIAIAVLLAVGFAIMVSIPSVRAQLHPANIGSVQLRK